MFPQYGELRPTITAEICSGVFTRLFLGSRIQPDATTDIGAKYVKRHDSLKTAILVPKLANRSQPL